MLTVGRFPRKDGSLPVWQRLGRLAGRFGAGGLAQGSALRELVEAARRSSSPPRASIVSGGRRVIAEAHYNRHAFLVLLAGEPVRRDRREGCRPDPRLVSLHR